MTRINVEPYINERGESVLGWFDDEKTTLWLESMQCCDEEGRHDRDVTGQHENLLRTKGGRWVVNEWFFDARHGSTSDDRYSFLTDSQAKAWLAANNYDKEYAEHFGEMPEEVGPGRPEIGGEVKVRLGTLLPEVDEWAKANGVNRAEAVRRLLGDALGAARMTAR